MIFNALNQKKKKKVANCKYRHKFLYLQTKYEKSIQKIVVRVADGVYPFDIVVHKLTQLVDILLVLGGDENGVLAVLGKPDVL